MEYAFNPIPKDSKEVLLEESSKQYKQNSRKMYKFEQHYDEIENIKAILSENYI